MIDPLHLKNYVIEPVLETMATYDPRMNDPRAINLLLGTAAQESEMGLWLGQNGVKDGAKGIYQMEDATFYDIKDRYLAQPDKEPLRLILSMWAPDIATPEILAGNLYAATFFTRVHYWMVPEPLPEYIEEQAEYYKEHYNTPLGKATVEQYMDRWDQFVEDKI